MLKWIWLLLISNSIYGFSITRTNQQLYLTSTNCQMATVLTNSLVIWKSILGEDISLCTMTSPVGKQQCSYNITPCAPNIVVKYHGEYPSRNGPNCWNSALVSSNILPALRYTAPEEMTFYMKSPLCHSLDSNDPPQPGDIGAIRDITSKGTLEVHGFIYLTPLLVYSKNEFFSSVAYRLMSLEEMYNDFSVPHQAECRQHTPSTHTNCKRAVEFFRCHSWAQHLQQNPIANQEIQYILTIITKFSIYLEKTNMQGTAFDDLRISSFVNNIEEFIQTLSAKKISSIQPDLFFLKSIYWRIFSLSEQLGMLFYIRENQKLLDLSISLHQYIRKLDMHFNN